MLIKLSVFAISIIVVISIIVTITSKKGDK